MKILYLHGLGSQPGGVKPTFLKAQGFEVINPALDNADFAAAVRTAQAAFDLEQPDLVVGSSRGGAVALNIDTGDVPVILIAPAWRKWGSVKAARPRTCILHSTGDTVIRHADSQELVARSGLDKGRLTTVGIDHNMVDGEALEALLNAVRNAASL